MRDVFGWTGEVTAVPPVCIDCQSGLSLCSTRCKTNLPVVVVVGWLLNVLATPCPVVNGSRWWLNVSATLYCVND